MILKLPFGNRPSSPLLERTFTLAITCWRSSHECETPHTTGVFYREDIILHELFGAVQCGYLKTYSVSYVVLIGNYYSFFTVTFAKR